jgi:hypothetical protein
MGGKFPPVYARCAMNPNPTTASSATSSSPSADAISRRAYELWEQDGRPDGADLRHWLQAEKELGGAEQSNGQSNGQASRATRSTQNSATPNTDTRPLQGTRGSAPTTRDSKRSGPPTSPSPFGDRAASSGGQTVGTKRR